jgi:cytoskeletal protein RodZ
MSKSNQVGVLNEETTAPRQGSQSTNAASLSTSATSATTAKAQSPKDSQPTPNLQDAPNAVRLIQALAGKLGTLVEWKRLTLGDGREVYALVFPVSKWQVNPESKELQPR